MANNIDVALRAKDEASKTFTNASARLRELRAEIDQLRAKNVQLTVGDAGRINALTREANQLERALQGVNQSGTIRVDTAGAQANVSQLQAGVGGLAGALGGQLVGALTATGVAMAAVKAARVTGELATLGAQSQVTKRSFDSVLDSIGGAPKLLNELTGAAGGTITQMRLMQLTNTALAGSSQELGGAFAAALPRLIEGARAANLLNPALGDTEFLFSSLVTGIKRGSPMLIDNTGITLKLGDANERYANALGKSVDALTDEERKLAILQGTLEGVDRLMVQVGGDLDTPISQIQAMGVATEELRTELGELVAQPYTVAVNMVTTGVRGITDILQGTQAARIAIDVDADTAARLDAITERLEYLNDLRERYANGENIYRFNDAAAAQEIVELQNLTAQLRVYGSATANVRSKLDDYLSAALGASGAQAQYNEAVQLGTEGQIAHAKAELEAAQKARDLALAAYQAAEGIARSAQTADNSTSSMLDLALAYDRVTASASAAASAASGPRIAGFDNTARIAQGYAYQSEAERALEEYLRKRANAQRAEEERAAAASLRLAQSTANKAASAWESEFQRAAGRISGYLSQGMSQAEGLFDLTPDLMQPGSNGPFENLFRTLDVAKLGGASPWAAQLGLTQEEAKKIGADFQRGIFSPEVIGLVDVNALINEAQMAQLAEKSKEAFANAIAQRAGVGTNVVGALFGLSGGSTGPGQGNQARTLVDSAMNQVAGVLGDSVKAEEFAGRVTGYGEMVWGYFETGIVAKARSSTALERAIAAMVSAAIGGQGGGFGATVRGAGGQ